MNAIAANIDQIDVVPAKDLRISKRIRQVVELLVSGACKTQKAAADRLDLHPDYVCRELKKPQVRVFIERSARESLANGTMRASARAIELLDAESEHVSADMTKHMLAIAGIKPRADAQVNVNVDIKAGYCIDLTDTQPMRAVGNDMGSKLIDG